MSSLIEKYYLKNNTMPMLLKRKLQTFDKHEAIAAEFDDWIATGSYKNENSISIEGYTAESLAKLSPYTSGEQAFILLAELRENPDKAKDRIARGFKIK